MLITSLTIRCVLINISDYILLDWIIVSEHSKRRLYIYTIFQALRNKFYHQFTSVFIIHR